MNEIVVFNFNQKPIFKMIGEIDFTPFSEVEITYQYLNKEIIVFRDFIIEGIKSLQITLKKALELDLQTMALGEKKSMGLLWNEYCRILYSEDEEIDDITRPFHLWSTESAVGIDTWIYNNNEKIFFEVAPTYQWHFDEPIDLNYTTYEQFMSEYAPINIFEINKDTAIEWLKACEDILFNFSTVSLTSYTNTK